MRSDQSTLNTLTAWFAIALVALAPIPVGSNRPLFWAIGAVLAGLWLAGYAFTLWRLNSVLRTDVKKMRIEMGLFAAFLLFVLLQILPLGLGNVAHALGPAFSQAHPANGPDASFASLSIAPGQSFVTFLKLATYPALFFLVAQAAVNPDRMRTMVTAVAVIGIAYALLGLTSLFLWGDTFIGLPKEHYLGSATATFINRNSFATFLGFGLIACVAIATDKLTRPSGMRGQNNNIDGIAFAFGAAVIFAGILATRSRMGVVADGAGALITFLLANHGFTGSKRSKWIVVSSVVAILVAVLILYGQGALERLGSIENDRDVRLNLYAQTLDLIALRPLTGHGAGTFELAFPLVHAAPVSFDMFWDKAHNTYLTLWAECGVIFGTLPLIAIGLFGIKTLQARLRSSNRRVPASIALGAISIAAIHSLADFSLEIHAVALMFTFILAVGAAGSLLPGGDDVR